MQAAATTIEAETGRSIRSANPADFVADLEAAGPIERIA
jgi:hypothetical protein